MIFLPAPSTYRPDPRIARLNGIISDPVTAAAFPERRLRFRNRRWDKAVGLGGLSDKRWIAHFGQFELLSDNLPQPLALRYHGHQFRVYNPHIGDGRGFLFAQLRDGNGRLLDFGTKGSGKTPYSRFGDGRLTLKGGVREVLATEMLEALGVETSKSFSLIETGEALERQDEPSPTRSSVLVRLGHGHIRIGTFQRLAALGEHDALRTLVGYCLETYFGEVPGPDATVRLLALVVGRTARLAASYMAAGFVHGVLNSDNINITGESFDYGPWRFTPTWEPGFTAAYFDQQGLYCFARQAQAIHWDVVQLGIALNEITETEPLAAALDTFPALHEAALAAAFLARLNLRSRDEESDLQLASAFEKGMHESRIPIDRAFFDWRDGRLRGEDTLYGDAFSDFRQRVADFEPVTVSQHSYWQDKEPCSMHIEEVETIWNRISSADDWSLFETKITAIRRMGAAHRGEAE